MPYFILPIDLNILSQFLFLKDESEYYIGTEPWSAKEVIIGDRITDKTDIFAFGLVLWEMLALTIPHTHLLGESFIYKRIN